MIFIARLSVLVDEMQLPVAATAVLPDVSQCYFLGFFFLLQFLSCKGVQFDLKIFKNPHPFIVSIKRIKANS